MVNASDQMWLTLTRPINHICPQFNYFGRPNKMGKTARLTQPNNQIRCTRNLTTFNLLNVAIHQIYRCPLPRPIVRCQASIRARASGGSNVPSRVPSTASTVTLPMKTL